MASPSEDTDPPTHHEADASHASSAAAEALAGG